jgi:small subunit ribosomal protein S17
MAAKKTEMKEEKKTEKIVGTRGRIFQGTVTKKFDRRVVLEFDRTVYVPKYERFTRKKTRLHARVPLGLNVDVGDYVKVQECRPLSKIIHFVVLEVLKRNVEEGEK